jgi:hypothetical protein
MTNEGRILAFVRFPALQNLSKFFGAVADDETEVELSDRLVLRLATLKSLQAPKPTQ